MMKIDTHVHSIASGHAFNTIYEIAASAKEKELDLVAITDHGPSMKGAPHLEYFSMSKRVPKKIYGVDILFGCEANIISGEGEIDISKEYISQLDIVLAGFHALTPYPTKSTMRINTNAMIRAMENYPIDIISHPYRLDYPIDVEEVAYHAAKENVILELNNSIFNMPLETINPELIKQTAKMIECSKKYKGLVAIGSDAHVITELGDDSAIRRIDKLLNLEGITLINTKEMLLKNIKNRRIGDISNE